MLTHLEGASTTSPHPHPTVLLHDSRAYGPLQVALGLLLDIRVPVLEGSFAFLAMLSPHEDSRAHRLELPWLVMVSPSEADTSFATVPIPPPSSKISTLGWRREHLSCASRRLGKVWSYQIRPLSERYQARAVRLLRSNVCYTLSIHWPVRLQVPWLGIIFPHGNLTVVAQREVP